MIRDWSRCHDPEVLAAFVAGTLSEEELEMTAAHLRTCEDCRFIAGEASRADRKADLAMGKAPRKISPWWLAAAAATLLGLLYAGLVWRGSSSERSPIAVLVDAAPRDGRYLEPRLSGGFPWAPLRSVRRDDAQPLDAGQLKLVGAAGAVLEKNAGDPSPHARHAVAVAHLVAGRARDAVRLLTALTRSKPDDSSSLNDLATARYALAMQTNDAGQLAEALAAVDAAIRIDPKAPEALFNRALIVERLGPRKQARAAWQVYLEIDPDSAWAGEARQHLNRLAPPASFRDELTRHYAELATSRALAHAFAARFPQECRVWCETEILGRWAEAVKRNDRDAAERHLRIARFFGEELAGSRGESLLLAAVAAAEHVTPAHLSELADAHLRFRTAQKTYGAGRPAEAERVFSQAAGGFELANSPVALLARYFAANTLYDQGKIDESRSRLEALLADAPPGFAAYRAQLEWQLGLAYASRGRWGEAMHALHDSMDTFERLGEMTYATSVREILAEVYDRIGDSRAAWHHRVQALQELGRTESLRLEAAIFASARAAAANRDWPVSVSLLSLQLKMARGGGDDLLYVETLLLRAQLQRRLGQPDAARADLAQARAAITHLRDATFVERAEAEYRAVEAGLARSPLDAVTLLGQAIDYQRVKGRRMFLPELLLHRGMALAGLGRATEAASDFESGIAEIEAQRQTLASGENRWGMFAAADELFDEAVSLALSRGDTARAYAYSERGRARGLLESIGRGHAAVPRTPLGVTVVEYASLPSELVIFVGTAGALRVVREPVARTTLQDEVERFTDGAVTGNRAEFRRASLRLHATLIEPVAGSIRPGTRLVFVPDATLRDVAFAALVNSSGRYLLEEHGSVVAPSAAVYTELAAHPIAPKRDLRLLLVAGVKAGQRELGYLSSADREADAVEAAYREVVRITPRDGKLDAFEAGASDSDVVHFIGHATADESRGAALLTSGADGLEHRLDVGTIASSRFRHTRVVVLAACSTAEGEERAREGSISVARAFIAAGVPSVIATLWPIDDRAAADFFPRLHRHLARGLSPAEALRFAQLESITSREASPFMWAAVQVIGS